MSGPFLGIDIGSPGAAGVPLSFRADLAPVAAAWARAVWDDSAFRGRVHRVDAGWLARAQTGARSEATRPSGSPSAPFSTLRGGDDRAQ
jgi:hypothetical protein